MAFCQGGTSLRSREQVGRRAVGRGCHSLPTHPIQVSISGCQQSPWVPSTIPGAWSLSACSDLGVGLPVRAWGSELCPSHPGNISPHPGDPEVPTVCVTPVPVFQLSPPGRVGTPGSGSAPPVPRTQALPGTGCSQHCPQRPSTCRLLRQRSPVRSRRENISLAFGEHFSFLFLLNKPPATFQNRTKKGQGQGAAETFHPPAPPASPGLAGEG